MGETHSHESMDAAPETARNPRNVHHWQPPRRTHHHQSSALDRQYSPSETHVPAWGGVHTESHTRGKAPCPRTGNRRPTGSQEHPCKVTHLQMDTDRWGYSQHSRNSVKGSDVSTDGPAWRGDSLTALGKVTAEGLRDGSRSSRAHRPAQAVTLRLGLTPEKT